MDRKDEDALREAIDRNCSLVLSLPSAGMLRHHKSRFLGIDRDTILIESVPTEAALIQSLMSNGDRCGMAFKSGSAKAVFASPIRALVKDYCLSSQAHIEALSIVFPTEMKSVQRRNNYRVSIPPDSGLKLRLWRIAPQASLAAVPTAAALVNAQVRDLSTGGIGVVLTGCDGQAPRIDLEDRLRIEIKTEQHTLVLEGQLRKPSKQDVVCIVTGVAFKKLQDDLEGRQIMAALTRICGELQRDELRRVRLGLVNDAA